MKRNFVTFETGMFRDELPDEELDRHRLGGDCARWLYSKLLGLEGISPGLEPLEEDWGWTFAIRVDGVRVWINIWPNFGRPKTWIAGIDPSPGLIGVFRRKRTESARARLRDVIDAVLASSPDIVGLYWSEGYPEE